MRSGLQEPLPLAHDVAGPVAGLPVVLLHGFPFDRHIWDDLSPRLAHAGFRPVRVDLPGFGESPAPAHHRSMGDLADDVDSLLKHLGMHEAVIVGFSMGGYVAMEIADRHPSRVAGLILVATRPEPDTPEGRKGRLDLANAVAKKGPRPLREAMLPKLLSKKSQLERRGLVRDVAAWFDRARPEAIATTLLALAERRDLRPTLSHVKAPTLVVVGSVDETLGVAPSELLAEKIPGARLEKIEGCGHMLMLEEPAKFHRIVVDWLQTLKA